MINLNNLNLKLDGDLLTDEYSKISYATDGSIYEKTPLAVCLPKSVEDIKHLINFSIKNNISLTPRTGGTSLAGQCVNENIIVDVSKHLNKIIEINSEKKYVIVEPGIVRDVLNKTIESHNLFFAVNTSTSNRASIGGMVGNNSSGSLSITYGTTRENILEITAILSNGKEVIFKDLTKDEFQEKLKLQSLEGDIYRQIYNTLKNPENTKEINENYPKKDIHRRNTGYAIDLLLEAISKKNELFNFCKLLSGSEGTLCFFTKIKLRLHSLPSKFTTVVCAHFSSLKASLDANIIAMQHKPYSCELMDKIILDCTKKNILQQKNRFFVKGNPESILVVEFRGHTQAEADSKSKKLVLQLKNQSEGYAFPLVKGKNVDNVWELRAAGLGLLANYSNEISAVESIEDTAVEINDLPNYISELDKLLKLYNQTPVYYAHSGAGELHIRPTLNLKKKEDIELLKTICKETFNLVKKYQGSISGEHGDGIIRSEFILSFYGEKIVSIFENLKDTWDPRGIFNPGKIVRPYSMDESIKYQIGYQNIKIDTAIDFSESGGMLSLAEKCTGSADCRKSEIFGGTMCPSFMATRNEQDTTRARANTLRKVITSNNNIKDIFSSEVLNKSLDLCLSCKGCTSECPSNVDMAALKAEYLYQRHKNKRISLKNLVLAYQPVINNLISCIIGRKNYKKILSTKVVQNTIKRFLNIHPKRNIPIISKESICQWYNKNRNLAPKKPLKTILLFVDEFINDLDATIGIKTIQLLYRLNYNVEIIKHTYSGRTFISKGLLDKALKCAHKNVNIFSLLVNDDKPLIGIEPSAILSFKDEYPKLLRGDMQKKASELSKYVYLIDDFLSQEFNEGNISSEQFSKANKSILFHGHCHQKSLAQVENSIDILRIPENFNVKQISSGCCGMAGSFGYEKEHYTLSKNIANLVLLPFINKNTHTNSLIVATGMSCREQIRDFSSKKVFHPVEILYDYLV